MTFFVKGNGYLAKCGFTLAELIIAILAIGVIATFTIPKLLTRSEETKKVAIFKEAYMALSTVAKDAVDQNINDTVSTTPNNYTNFILNNLNAFKKCYSNANTEGCTSSSGFDSRSLPVVTYTDNPAVILHNGAYIGGLRPAGPGITGAGCLFKFNIDYNGDLPPNKFCNGPNQDCDTLVIGMNLTQTDQAFYGCQKKGTIGAGGVGGREFRWIFDK